MTEYKNSDLANILPAKAPHPLAATSNDGSQTRGRPVYNSASPPPSAGLRSTSSTGLHLPPTQPSGRPVEVAPGITEVSAIIPLLKLGVL